MYKLEIDVSDWVYEDEVVTIESHDFDKLAIIAEFIEFQKEYGWAADYDVTEEFAENQADEVIELDSEEAEDSAEIEIGEIVEDEDGVMWERVA
jgi:hypothetical protein